MDAATGTTRPWTSIGNGAATLLALPPGFFSATVTDVNACGTILGNGFETATNSRRALMWSRSLYRNDRDAISTPEKHFDLEANPVGGIVESPGAVDVARVSRRTQPPGTYDHESHPRHVQCHRVRLADWAVHAVEHQDDPNPTPMGTVIDGGAVGEVGNGLPSWTRSLGVRAGIPDGQEGVRNGLLLIVCVPLENRAAVVQLEGGLADGSRRRR